MCLRCTSFALVFVLLSFLFLLILLFSFLHLLFQGVWRKPPWAVGASAPIGASVAAAAGTAAGAAGSLIDEDSLVDPKETYTPLGKG